MNLAVTKFLAGTEFLAGTFLTQDISYGKEGVAVPCVNMVDRAFPEYIESVGSFCFPPLTVV